MEEWRPIPGFEGYQASSLGRVKSRRKILKTDRRVNNSGYQTVGLTQGVVKAVHWCVASAFFGPDLGRDVNHLNGNKQDNAVANLAFVSRSENMSHAYAIGLVKPYDRSGTKNPRAKLTEEQIRELVLLGRQRVRQYVLAKQFNINKSHVSRLLMKHGVFYGRGVLKYEPTRDPELQTPRIPAQ